MLLLHVFCSKQAEYFSYILLNSKNNIDIEWTGEARGKYSSSSLLDASKCVNPTCDSRRLREVIFMYGNSYT